MPISDLLDLFRSAADLVNFYWNFYVIGIVAVLGWLFSLKRALTRRQKIILTTVYVGFIALNLLALVNSYRFMEAARLDALGKISVRTLPNLRQMLVSTSFAEQQWMGWIVHGVVDAAVIAAIWLFHADAEESPGESGRSA
jgi:hypothetical protein